jgi:hypothetical protein
LLSKIAKIEKGGPLSIKRQKRLKRAFFRCFESVIKKRFVSFVLFTFTLAIVSNRKMVKQ